MRNWPGYILTLILNVQDAATVGHMFWSEQLLRDDILRRTFYCPTDGYHSVFNADGAEIDWNVVEVAETSLIHTAG